MSIRTTFLNRCIAVGLGLAVLGGLGPSFALADQPQEEIEAISTATERFKDVNVAIAEGYIPDPNNHCVTSASEGLPPELGAMGIHYLHPERLGIIATKPRVDGNGTHTDFSTPAILLYEPQADGSLVLVGVENLVFEKAWRAAGNSTPPVFAGRTWDHMMDDPDTQVDEAHGFEPHWDQHVWLRENPSHALEPFNSAVTCEHHKN